VVVGGRFTGAEGRDTGADGRDAGADALGAGAAGLAAGWLFGFLSLAFAKLPIHRSPAKTRAKEPYRMALQSSVVVIVSSFLLPLAFRSGAWHRIR
jgi:hypothetical protein